MSASTEAAPGAGARGRTVLVAGAGSPSGVAVCEALDAAGARVIAVGSSAPRLEAALGHLPDADLRVCDLAESGEVRSLASDLREAFGGVDGVIHLVGGWRGGGGLDGQTDEDWTFLERNILRTLRNVSRSFYGQLVHSTNGRLAIVSSTAVDSPAAGGAGYAAAKAAAEAWTRALASGFAKDQSGRGALHSAAVVFVVKALVDEAMRRQHPEKAYPGYTDVQDLAAAVTELFDEPAERLNGRRISLVPAR